MIILHSGQVVIGGFDVLSNPLSKVEIFPRPLSESCSIPDLPEPRYGHTISLLPGGKLVVCGGVYEGSDISATCIQWAAGDTTWTRLFTMRFHTIAPVPHPFNIFHLLIDAVSQDSVTQLGHHPLFLTPLSCWAATGKLQQSLLRKMYQAIITLEVSG